MMDLAKLQNIAANSAVYDGKMAAQKILTLRDKIKSGSITHDDAKQELIGIAIAHTKMIIQEESDENKSVFIKILNVTNSSGKAAPASQIIDQLALS